MLREKCLPLIRMSDHFDIPNAKKDVTKGIMLFCKDGGKEAVLMADRITVDQQVVENRSHLSLTPIPSKNQAWQAVQFSVTAV